MKKQFLFPLIISFLFSSCINVWQTGTDPDNPGVNPPASEDKATVIFKNNSVYDVNVYVGFSPYYKEVGATFFTVKASSSYEKNDVSLLDNEKAVYFEYLIDVGNAKIPYCDRAENGGYNFKTLFVSKTENKTLEIDALTECHTNSAFFLIENKTSSSIEVTNGAGAASIILKPLSFSGSTSRYIEASDSGVFEVDENGTCGIDFGYYDFVKVHKGNDTFELPSEMTKNFVEKGNIYTLVLSTDSSSGSETTKFSLRSVTPFNIDTTKKIWSLNDVNLKYDPSNGIKSVLRPSYDLKSSLIMGTLASDLTQVALLRINEYGKYEDGKVFKPSAGSLQINNTVVLDFFEQSDGSLVMLLKLDCIRDGQETHEFLYSLNCYDFEKRKALWNYTFSDFIPLFRHDSKNKIIRLEDNRLALAGGFVKAGENPEEYKYSPLIVILDFTKENSDGETFSFDVEKSQVIYKPASSGFYDYESLFTSLYFDGTTIYASGYVNFSGKYDSSTEVHSGVVYKFSPENLSSSAELVYSKERCLFLSIDGLPAGKISSSSVWFTSGEYWNDNSDGCSACFVSSYMAKNDGNPVLYSSGKQYNWFNQLCAFSNKIILCGPASGTIDASSDVFPCVVCYDLNGNRLWENLSYKDYKDALNIIPNSYGTYQIQLVPKSGNYLHYVNADLLGMEKIK